jgi:hypothetical protein
MSASLQLILVQLQKVEIVQQLIWGPFYKTILAEF